MSFANHSSGNTLNRIQFYRDQTTEILIVRLPNPYSNKRLTAENVGPKEAPRAAFGLCSYSLTKHRVLTMGAIYFYEFQETCDKQ